VFGRKTHGPSSLAIELAQPDTAAVAPHFTTRMTGSYEREEWKQRLRDRLRHHGTGPKTVGPLSVSLGLTTGAQRNWANLWKPLIDSLGPILGEDPNRPFHPHDDRVVDLSLHHHVDIEIGHDVIIDVWWAGS
jgi:hypothetical protein